MHFWEPESEDQKKVQIVFFDPESSNQGARLI